MKKTTTAGALALALMIGGTGLDAQQSRAGSRVANARVGSCVSWEQGQRGPQQGGPRMSRRAVPGAERLSRALAVTLDQAEVSSLSQDQIAGLRELQEEVMAVAEVQREERLAFRDAQRQARDARIRDREPLPADSAARAQVLDARRAEAAAHREEMRAQSQDFQDRMAATLDPLVQRYEQLVPPSQRPRPEARDGRGRQGQRGAVGRRHQDRRPRRGSRGSLG